MSANTEFCREACRFMLQTRQTGQTTILCQSAPLFQIPPVIVAANQLEQLRIKELAPLAVVITPNPRDLLGRGRAPLLFDHFAIQQILGENVRTIDVLTKKRDSLQETINTLHKITSNQSCT